MGALSILQLPKLHEFRIFNWLSPICLLKSLSFYCLVINFILGSEVQYKLKVTKKKKKVNTLLLTRSGTIEDARQRKTKLCLTNICIHSTYVCLQINLSTLHIVRISHQRPLT